MPGERVQRFQHFLDTLFHILYIRVLFNDRLWKAVSREDEVDLPPLFRTESQQSFLYLFPDCPNKEWVRMPSLDKSDLQIRSQILLCPIHLFNVGPCACTGPKWGHRN